MKRNMILAVSAMGLLVACGGDAPHDPKTLSVFYEKDKIRGEYDPAGLSSDTVKKMLAGECKEGRLNGYSEQASSRGLIAYTATCAGGNLFTSGLGNISVRDNNLVVRDAILSDKYGEMFRQIDQTKVLK